MSAPDKIVRPSLSARRAWIEIAVIGSPQAIWPTVALRKESVDRNRSLPPASRVAWLSLSARRAWIEIPVISPCCHCLSGVALRKESVDRNPPCQWRGGHRQPVALRKESVDRNSSWVISSSRPRRSLSARRAWIEMSRPALSRLPMAGRSPQGERG